MCMCVCVAWGGLWSESKECVSCIVSVLRSGLICVSVGESVVMVGCKRCQILNTVNMG